MLTDMARLIVVKATAGSDAPERCSQAFTVASTAVAAGATVSFWLTGESAWFALPGRAAEFELPHAAPLPDLLDLLLANGRVTVCTQCAARRGIGPEDVLVPLIHRRFYLAVQPIPAREPGLSEGHDHGEESADYEVMHGGRFALIDRQWRVRAWYDGQDLDPDRVLGDIRQLLR